jgi:hypothetical protein
MTKKKFILLRGRFGNFIVVSREEYERRGMGTRRGSNQMWKMVRQGNDEGALKAMASLTGRYVPRVDVTEYIGG